MKRIICCLMTLVLLLPLASCAAYDEDSDVLRVVTTVFPPYDYVRQITAEASDRVQLTMLLPPGSESHDYEPSLSDIAAVGSCDLFICVGGETDDWVEDVVAAVGGEVNVLRLMDHVSLLCEEEHDHSGHSHNHGHGETYDEHVWTTPANGADLCDAVCRELCLTAPDLAESFKKCGDAYSSSLRDLAEEYDALAESKLRDVVIFADRFPFRYLTESMGLHGHAAFEGCSSDSEPSLSTIFELTEEAKECGVPVILTAELYSGSTAETVAEECGVPVMELHSCHNVTKEQFQSGVTCLQLMERNLEVLRFALNEKGVN